MLHFHVFESFLIFTKLFYLFGTSQPLLFLYIFYFASLVVTQGICSSYVRTIGACVQCAQVVRNARPLTSTNISYIFTAHTLLRIVQSAWTPSYLFLFFFKVFQHVYTTPFSYTRIPNTRFSFFHTNKWDDLTCLFSTNTHWGRLSTIPTQTSFIGQPFSTLTFPHCTHIPLSTHNFTHSIRKRSHTATPASTFTRIIFKTPPSIHTHALYITRVSLFAHARLSHITIHDSLLQSYPYLSTCLAF